MLSVGVLSGVDASLEVDVLLVMDALLGVDALPVIDVLPVVKVFLFSTISFAIVAGHVWILAKLFNEIGIHAYIDFDLFS